MEQHYQLTDSEFANRFADGTLEPKWFTHLGHLRLAWILLRRHGLPRAEALICRQIQDFDQMHGDGTKFNYTVTVAAMRAVHHFMQRSLAVDFPTFIAEFPALRSNLKGLLATHYSVDIFSDSRAKHRWLEPDLSPF